jgi:hypothetical protein
MSESHAVRGQVRHDAHDPAVSSEQHFEVAGLFKTVQQRPGVERRRVPAGHVASIVVAVTEPDRLVAAPQRFDHLQRPGGLFAVAEVLREEIHMLVRGLIDEQFRAVGIGRVYEGLVKPYNLPIRYKASYKLAAWA